MKVKNIEKLKQRLENATEEIELQEDGTDRMTLKYDAWEEMFYLDYGDKQIILSVEEAKNLRTVLNNML